MYSLIYLGVISLISVIVTVIDKLLAKAHKRRVSEKALLYLSAVGGSFAMLITMILIRHKTKHTVFMAGIPLIIIIQFLFTGFVIFYLKNM